jgi:lipoprotein-releasing system ATP-binding protein
MLKARNIVKSYGALPVLKGIDLDIAQGEVIALTGPSGAGKTTLLQIVGTLDRPDGGTLHWNDQDLLALKGNNLSRFRNRTLGFVFQFHNLLPEFSALENVMIPGMVAGTPTKELKARGMELLDLLGIAQRATHKPSELSGGEQQRVAVARALINRAPLILADEPSGNLDTHHAKQLHELFFTLRDRFRHTFLIVTHNEALAAMADRQIKIQDGRVEG